MKTDAFLYQLLKQLPQALFELLGESGERARSYRFDSVELKKSLRIDGVMLPATSELPLYFVELQFQSVAKFYAAAQVFVANVWGDSVSGVALRGDHGRVQRRLFRRSQVPA